MNTNDSKLLSVQDASISKGVHQETVRRAIRSGRLPAMRVGRALFIRTADLSAWEPEYAKAPGRLPPRGRSSERSADLQSAPLPRSRPRTKTEAAPSHNIVLPITPLIGREREIEALHQFIGSGGRRLITLTGPGGSGKTRLALELASQLIDRFGGAVWFVDLSAISDPDLILSTIAQPLELRSAGRRPIKDVLIEWLRGRPVLLVLDNCEHVLDGIPVVASLLHECPELRILATSRATLHLDAEQVVPLMTLRLPDSSLTQSASGIQESPAIELFVQRALAIEPEFRLTDANARSVAEICSRLDGLPLAIELATAWVRVLSVEQIASRLDDRFRLLNVSTRSAMPRQQSLRATIDWSYALLTEAERGVFRRLAVFAGGWTLEAAEAIASGDDVQPADVLELLARLVDKSLVIAEVQPAAARYRLHESIRQYTLEQLHASGEHGVVKDRHLGYYLRFAEEAEVKLRGEGHHQFLDLLELEHPNLRAALDWALQPGREDGAALRLSGALAWFWWVRSYLPEGRHWTQRALSESHGPPEAQLKALYSEGILAHFQRDAPAARQYLNEALTLARELNDRWAEAWILHHLGRNAYYTNDAQTARALGQQSLDLAEEIGDDWLVAWALHLLGLAAHIAADYPAARTYYEQSLELRQQLGYREGIGILHCLLGLVAIREGDAVRALTLLKMGIPNSRGIQGPIGMATPLAASAFLAASFGQPLSAIRIGGVVDKIRESTQMSIVPIFETLLQEAIEQAKLDLSEEEFAAAWEDGREMSLEQAIDEALAIDPTPLGRATPRNAASPTGTLTPAEQRVLRLIAIGKTSREIADQLFISTSTVDRHLTHIYAKLGVRNRAEAATLALRRQLV